MMIFLKWLIICCVFTALGGFLGGGYVRYGNLVDEYAYFLRVNNVLYDIGENNIENVHVEMNTLLYQHFTRYLTHRNALPRFLIDDVDELMCGSFAMTPDTFQMYKKQLDAKIYSYMNKHLDFCQFTLEHLGSVDRIK